jgi:hypothetical protein
MAEEVDDPILDPLAWDSAQGWYLGETDVTPGHLADLNVGVDDVAFWSGETDLAPGPPAEEDMPAFLARAGRTLNRLRRDDARLRRLAAEALRKRYPERVEPLSVEEAAGQLWVAVVYFWSDGSARIDWDVTPRHLLNWNSSNWVSHITPRGRCRKVAWDHEGWADEPKKDKQGR